MSHLGANLAQFVCQFDIRDPYYDSAEDHNLNVSMTFNGEFIFCYKTGSGLLKVQIENVKNDIMRQ